MINLQWLQADVFSQSLAWTLLHSLWQASLIALLIKAIFITLRPSKPIYRYNLIIGGFLILLIWNGISFSKNFAIEKEKQLVEQTVVLSKPTTDLALQELMLYESFNPESSPPVATSEPAEFEEVSDLSTVQLSILQQWLAPLRPWLPWVCLIWSIGVLLLSIRFVGNLLYLRQLYKARHEALSDFWKKRLITFSQHLGLRRKVELYESRFIQEPLTMGFLKPLILFPIGLVNQLDTAQIEAILLHELAHIRRADFLINLFQCCLEILFFFNPAVYWLSGQLREERELCCDDLVLSYSQQPLPYAEALLQVQRSNTKPALALHASGQEGSLSRRIKRLFNTGKPQSPNRLRALIMASLICSIGLLSTGYLWKLQTEEYVIISGEVKDNATSFIDYIVLVYDEEYFGQQKQLLVPIDENKQFIVKLSIHQAQEIRIFQDREVKQQLDIFKGHPFLVEPGAKIHINMSGDEEDLYFGGSRSYSFKGSDARTNNMINTYLSAAESWDRPSIWNIHLEGLENRLFQSHKIYFDAYDKERENLERFIQLGYLKFRTSKFYQWAKQHLDYNLMRAMLKKYPRFITQNLEDAASQEFFEDFEIKDSNAMSSAAYLAFIYQLGKEINAQECQTAKDSYECFSFLLDYLDSKGNVILGNSDHGFYEPALLNFAEKLPTAAKNILIEYAFQQLLEKINHQPLSGAREGNIKQLKKVYEQALSITKDKTSARRLLQMHEQAAKELGEKALSK